MTAFPRPMTSTPDNPANRQVAWAAAGTLGALVLIGLLIGLALSWLLLDSRTTTPYRPGSVATLPERGDARIALAPVAGPEAGERQTAPLADHPADAAVLSGLDGASADLHSRADQAQAAVRWPEGGPGSLAHSDLIDPAAQRRTVHQPAPPAIDQAEGETPALPAEPSQVTVRVVEEPPPPQAAADPSTPLDTSIDTSPDTSLGTLLDGGIQAGLTVSPVDRHPVAGTHLAEAPTQPPAEPAEGEAAEGEASARVATAAVTAVVTGDGIGASPRDTADDPAGDLAADRTVIAGPLLHGAPDLDLAMVAVADAERPPASPETMSTATSPAAAPESVPEIASDPVPAAVPGIDGVSAAIGMAATARFPGTVFPGADAVSFAPFTPHTPTASPDDRGTDEGAPDDGVIADRTPVDPASTDALALTLQREFPHPAGEGMEIANLLAPYPPIDKDSLTILTVSDSDALDTLFAEHGFNWLEAPESAMPVPRILVGAFPDDIVQVNTLAQRKRLFFNTVLPIILQVNESILADRARLAGIRAELNSGREPDASDAAFLADLARRYETGDADADLLMRRVDVIPPSMALAQGAVESGWGTSSLARQGNALFGQITASPDGLSNAGQGFRFAAFDTLYDSVDAYALNLNTHPAYRDFRALRSEMRRDGQPIDGYALIGTLDAYSELGEDYITYIRRVMRANDLMALDDLRLEAPTIAEAAL
ncbi:MAG: glucosaminidase domain-containing protein [Azospirillaceae bacterium]